MRISRLSLTRYGHLSDTELVFPAERGLHVVLGANEAGKSTALAALGDCLFGFPHRSEFAFLHETRDLRIGVDVRAGDGRHGRFVRLKRRKDDLLDAEDRPLPESAIAAFLGGATRERFERVFGLNAAELRRGGDAILQGQGEVGESILQAQTGLHGFRTLVDRLDVQAEKLFGDRRGKRELHVSVDAYKAAKLELERRSIVPAAYLAAEQDRTRLQQEAADDARASEALHAARARLERIRRTAPALAARARAIEARDALGPVAKLPADAEALRQSAVAARDRAAHDLARERARDVELAAELAALHVDATVLSEADAIDRLANEQNRIVAARGDREKQRIVAGQRQRAVEAAGQRLGLLPDGAAIVARIPNALARAAAGRALESYQKLIARREKLIEDVETARRTVADTDAALAGLPAAEDPAALRAAIDAAKAEGRIDAELATARSDLEAAAAALKQGLAALPIWHGSAAELASAKLPLDAVWERAAQHLAATEDALRDRQARLAACDAELLRLTAELGGIAASGTLPTAEAIADARTRRDRAWRLLRRHRIDGGAAPTDAELAGLGTIAALPDLFETFLQGADALVDSRAELAERVIEFEQLRTREVRERTLRQDAAAAASAAETAHAEAVSAWAALWQMAGIDAAPPAAMREWLRLRADLLVRLNREHDAQRKLALVSARHAAAWQALAELVPDAATAAGSLAALLHATDRLCREHEQAREARDKASLKADDARAALVKAVRALEKLDIEQAGWRTDWSHAAAGLGLGTDAAPDDGKLALDLWRQIETEALNWRAALDRIEEMTADIDSFATDAAALVGRVAPELAAVGPHDAVRVLAARLADARIAERERAKRLRDRAVLAATIARHATALDDAATTLLQLRAAARVDDDAALAAAIATAAEHAMLSLRIAERDAELARETQPLAELAADAAGEDADTLGGRLAGTEQQLHELNNRNAVRSGRLTELRAMLADMAQGHDAAGAAQHMQNALAEIDDIAARYVRLRLAHTLLRTGIDRFRRQQQAPLLNRAGALFARLTEDRYCRLGVDASDDGEPTLLAVRPDNSDCPAARLSEGTRDQLYLALRLAAIESSATHSEPLPFIADDLLVNFDDRRALAALRVLGEFSATTQTILFTHHAHVVELADPALASVHRLAG